MGAVALFPLNYLREEEAIPSPRKVVVHTYAADIATRVKLVIFKPTDEKTHHVKYVLRIQPRNFAEVAGHFAKVTKPINWLTDEPDVE